MTIFAPNIFERQFVISELGLYAIVYPEQKHTISFGDLIIWLIDYLSMFYLIRLI